MTTIEEQLNAIRFMQGYFEGAIDFERIGPMLNDIASTVAAVKNYDQTIDRLQKENNLLNVKMDQLKENITMLMNIITN